MLKQTRHEVDYTDSPGPSLTRCVVLLGVSKQTECGGFRDLSPMRTLMFRPDLTSRRISRGRLVETGSHVYEQGTLGPIFPPNFLTGPSGHVKDQTGTGPCWSRYSLISSVLRFGGRGVRCLLLPRFAAAVESTMLLKRIGVERTAVWAVRQSVRAVWAVWAARAYLVKSMYNRCNDGIII